MGVSAGAAVVITASSPLTVDEDVIAAGAITLTATDSAGAGDDLTVRSDVTVQSTGSSVTLNGGDDVTIAATAAVIASTSVTINGDFGNADAGTGTTVDVLGALTAGTTITINGNTDDDMLRGSTSAETINGNGGLDTLQGRQGNDDLNGGADNDTIVWNNGDGSDTMDGDAGVDTVQVNLNDGLGDTATVSDQNNGRFTFTRIDGGVGLGPFTLDVGTIEALDVNGQAGADNITVENLDDVTFLTQNNLTGGNGADTFTISPSDDVGVDVVGGDPTTAPGDSLLFLTPSGQVAALTPNGADGGTIATTGSQTGCLAINYEAPNIRRFDFNRAASPSQAPVAPASGPTAYIGVLVTDLYRHTGGDRLLNSPLINPVRGYGWNNQIGAFDRGPQSGVLSDLRRDAHFMSTTQTFAMELAPGDCQRLVVRHDAIQVRFEKLDLQLGCS